MKIMQVLPELIGYLAALLTTASFLPQALLTLRTRDTASLSLSMYAIFTLGVLLWLIYGIFLRNTAIIAANAVTLLLSASILYVKVHNKLTGRERLRAPETDE
jgi:MtN3 and saliva related transmembrane protein